MQAAAWEWRALFDPSPSLPAKEERRGGEERQDRTVCLQSLFLIFLCFTIMRIS